MQSLTSFTTNSLQEALNTLKTTSGIFSRIDNAFGDLTCYDADGNAVVTFKQVTSDPKWNVIPVLSNGASIDENHKLKEVMFSEGYLCEQGLYLITTAQSDIKRQLIIAKGSNGKCCVIITAEYSSFYMEQQYPLYVTTRDDDTSLVIYQQGVKSPGYFASSGSTIADRTILEKIPIVGARGSNDYVSGCFTIFMRQFQDPGSIIIDGKKYYCRNRFAILDE